MTHRSSTATAVAGDRGAGHLLIGMIRTLAAEIDTLAPASACAVADSVTQILIAGLSAIPAAGRPAVSRLTAYHRERIRGVVRRRLREPGFGLADIADELRVSQSTLQRAWAGEPCTMGEWIWSQRLDGARRDLGSPACAARSVCDIAFSWGFNDAAHFSRAFRTRSGVCRANSGPAAAEIGPRSDQAYEIAAGRPKPHT